MIGNIEDVVRNATESWADVGVDLYAFWQLDGPFAHKTCF